MDTWRGEPGHIICLDKHTTGDGIIAGLQVLAALRQHNVTLKEMCGDLVFYPQKLVNVPIKAGFDWLSSASIKLLSMLPISSSKVQDGFCFVPQVPSHCYVMVEGEGEDRVTRIASTLAEAVRSAAAATT
jgi:phosphoglucosamine mutase